MLPASLAPAGLSGLLLGRSVGCCVSAIVRSICWGLSGCGRGGQSRLVRPLSYCPPITATSPIAPSRRAKPTRFSQPTLWPISPAHPAGANGARVCRWHPRPPFPTACSALLPPTRVVAFQIGQPAQRAGNNLTAFHSPSRVTSRAQTKKELCEVSVVARPAVAHCVGGKSLRRAPRGVRPAVFTSPPRPVAAFSYGAPPPCPGAEPSPPPMVAVVGQPIEG